MEGGNLGVENGGQERFVLDARGNHNLTSRDPRESCADDILGGHAGHGGQVDALHGVELGGDDPRAYHMHAHAGSVERSAATTRVVTSGSDAASSARRS